MMPWSSGESFFSGVCGQLEYAAFSIFLPRRVSSFFFLLFFFFFFLNMPEFFFYSNKNFFFFFFQFADSFSSLRCFLVTVLFFRGRSQGTVVVGFLENVMSPNTLNLLNLLNLLSIEPATKGFRLGPRIHKRNRIQGHWKVLRTRPQSKPDAQVVISGACTLTCTRQSPLRFTESSQRKLATSVVTSIHRTATVCAFRSCPFSLYARIW